MFLQVIKEPMVVELDPGMNYELFIICFLLFSHSIFKNFFFTCLKVKLYNKEFKTSKSYDFLKEFDLS